MAAKSQSTAVQGRYNTDEETKRVVWVQAAGHCELCGIDLTFDYRAGKAMRWGEVAHILPASPKGPRGRDDHDESQAEERTNDTANLMLLCPSCHDKIDRDADGYPESDLSNLHNAYLQRIRLAATTPDGGRAVPLMVLSQHFKTVNDIPMRDLLTAMSAEGLTAFDHGIKLTIPQPGPQGRDGLYWQQVKNVVRHQLDEQVSRRGGLYGDSPMIAVVGLADIPALMMLGQALGDRSKRVLFSPNREHGLRWPDALAEPPSFVFTPAPEGEGPLALVLSISAHVPHRDVSEALPGARIAELTIPAPSYAMVKNRRVIHAFRDALQVQLSRLEAMTADPISVFAAIPAVLAIEFGALLTTQHQHAYAIFDRDQQGQFALALTLGSSSNKDKSC